MKQITILPGHNKNGIPEQFKNITLECGNIYTIVGNTGSGKSRFIKDIEQLATGDSVTGRRILLDGKSIEHKNRRNITSNLVAHLGQNMRFVLDTTVEQFIKLHSECRNCNITVDEVLSLTNDITPEPVTAKQNLNLLSGGQARAVMIADIALLCDSPIVLIDEIENAGVDKEKSFSLLRRQDKLVLVVTHDPHTALMAPKRIVMNCGEVLAVVNRSEKEEKLYEHLSVEYHRNQTYQNLLRKGENLN